MSCLEIPTRPTTLNNDPFPNNHPRNLPNWLWIAITKSLGIKKFEEEKPILACALYVLTVASSLGLIIGGWWFTAYDIISDYTKTSVISGSVEILYNIFWVAFGIYANNLAYRLYSHPHFFKLVKLHSKSIFRMNAAVILFILMALFILINNINGFSTFQSNTCVKVGLSRMVCKFRYIFRLMFSICTLLWNYLVAFAMTSICRSHVVRIRKFMKVLEQDSNEYEARFLGIGQIRNFESEVKPLEEYSWVEENYLDELREDEGEENYLQKSVVKRVSTLSSDDSFLQSSSGASSAQSLLDMQIPIPPKKKSISPSLSNDEILFNYFKIQTDLRKSSVALQRWMMSLISLVAIWMAMNLAFWLNNEPNIVDLANFFLPLLLLPLLTSAYAEVNQEGQRLIKHICLSDHRIQLMLLLQVSPLQMTVYGYGLSYSTIGTALFGVLIAMSSKILLQEMFGK